MIIYAGGHFFVLNISFFNFAPFHGITGYRYDVPTSVFVAAITASDITKAAAIPGHPKKCVPISISILTNFQVV